MVVNRKSIAFYNILYVAVFAILSVVSIGNSFSQDASWHPVYDQYSISDGLPSVETYFSYQDKDGYIWIATDEGVARYNGQEFKVFTTKDGLISDVVFKIIQDDKDRIWFLSNSLALCYYENGEIKPYKYNHKLLEFSKDNEIVHYTDYSFKGDDIIMSTSRLKPFKIDGNGKLEIIKPDLSDMDPTTSILIFEYEGLHLNYSTDYSAGPNSMINIELHWDKNKYKTSFITSKQNYSFIKIDVGTYYLRVANRSILIKNGKMESYHSRHIIYYSGIIDGELWVGYAGDGVKVFNISNGKLDLIDHLFRGSSISNVMKDSDGKYWFNSTNEALFCIKSRSYRKLQSNRVKNGSIFSIGLIENDLIFEEENEKLQFIDLKTMEFVKYKNEPKNVLREGIKYDPQSKEVFVCVFEQKYKNHLKRIENREFVPFIKETSGNNIKQLRIDEYLSTSYKGIGILKEGSLKENNRVFLFEGKVYNIELQEVNTIWVATSKGVKLLDIKSGKVSETKYPELNQKVNSILRIDDAVLFATNDNGLMILKDGKIKQLTIQNGLCSNSIQKISSDDNGNVALLSKNGVSFINLNIGSDIRSFNVRSQELNVEKLNDILMSDGHCYLTTNQGLFKLKIDYSHPKNKTPKLLLKNVTVDSRLPFGRNFKLSHDVEDITINFDAISFDKNSVQFRYKLNSNEVWRVVTERFIELNYWINHLSRLFRLFI